MFASAPLGRTIAVGAGKVAASIALGGRLGVSAIAGDTDGVDGAEEVAGAIITPETLARAINVGVSPRVSLDNNDGHGFFAKLGDQVITGPTLTNANDFRAIIITATNMEGGPEDRA